MKGDVGVYEYLLTIANNCYPNCSRKEYKCHWLPHAVFLLVSSTCARRWGGLTANGLDSRGGRSWHGPWGCLSKLPSSPSPCSKWNVCWKISGKERKESSNGRSTREEYEMNNYDLVFFVIFSLSPFPCPFLCPRHCPSKIFHILYAISLFYRSTW